MFDLKFKAFKDRIMPMKLIIETLTKKRDDQMMPLMLFYFKKF